MRVPISGGLGQLVCPTIEQSNVYCSPLGGCVVIEFRSPDKIVFALDPIRGKGAELMKLPPGPIVALLPDGNRVTLLSLQTPVAGTAFVWSHCAAEHPTTSSSEKQRVSGIWQRCRCGIYWHGLHGEQQRPSVYTRRWHIAVAVVAIRLGVGLGDPIT